MVPVCGGIISGLLKALWTAIKAVTDFIAKFLWYTGLFVPALYALFGVVLYLGWGFDPFATGTYPLLYRIGFYLSVAVAVIIVYRRLTKNLREKQKERRKAEEEQRRKEEARRRKEERARRREEERRDVEYRERYLKKRREERRARKRVREEPADDDYTFDEAVRLGERGRAEYEKLYDPDVIYDTSNTSKGNRKSDYGYLDDDYSSGEVIPQIYMSALEKDVLVHEYPDRFEVYKLDGGKKTLDKIEYK